MQRRDDSCEPPDFEKGYFFRIQNDVVDKCLAVVEPNAAALFMILCRYADNDTGKVCGISVGRIQRLMGRGRTLVFELLGVLEANGLIARRYTGRENEYFIANVRNRLPSAPTEAKGKSSAKGTARMSTGLAHPGETTNSPPRPVKETQDHEAMSLEAGVIAPARVESARMLWNAVLVELKNRMDADTYDRIFRDTWGEAMDDTYLYVGYTDSKHRDLSVMWRFSRDIKGYLKKFGHPLAPHFIPESQGAQR